VIPFRTKPGTYYSATSKPGYVIAHEGGYLMFFSASTADPIRRTLGIARTKDLDGPWQLDPEPIVPPAEQVENSSVVPAHHRPAVGGPGGGTPRDLLRWQRRGADAHRSQEPHEPRRGPGVAGLAAGGVRRVGELPTAPGAVDGEHRHARPLDTAIGS